MYTPCLLYTSDAADERSSVDLGGRRIIKKKKKIHHRRHRTANTNTMQNNDIKLWSQQSNNKQTNIDRKYEKQCNKATT